MTQMADASPWIDAVLEYSTDGAAFTDCSGNSTLITASGGERMSADTHTGDANTPIVTFGKKGSIEVSIFALFSDTASTLHVDAMTAYDGDSALYFQWFPEGKTVGLVQYLTSAGRVMAPPYVTGEYGSADAVGINITIRVATVTASTYSTA